jgi:hypothetical protein
MLNMQFFRHVCLISGAVQVMQHKACLDAAAARQA